MQEYCKIYRVRKADREASEGDREAHQGTQGEIMPGNDAQCCARRCGGLLVSVPAFSPTIPGSNLGAPPQCGLPPLRSYCTNNLKPPRPRWAVKRVLRSCLPFGGSESVRFSGSGSVRFSGSGSGSHSG